MSRTGCVWRATGGESGHEVAINPTLFDDPTDLLGTLLHEAAHAYAANMLGDTTAKDLGRMSLNHCAILTRLAPS